MKSPIEDYKIRKLISSDPGSRADLLIFLYFNKLVIYLVEAINVFLKYKLYIILAREPSCAWRSPCKILLI